MQYYEHITKDVWDEKYVIQDRRSNNWSSKTVPMGAFRLRVVGIGFVTHTRVEELGSKLCKNFKELMT